ncbi:TRAP transporter small permease [Falsigemmobacter faecalis]|uniref:TRAP transporter small permease protein n=1 Tax=Falsigemmobacter faecalis TaxID=2488730 RepID=A0A3P3D3N4_9RHOB|nr:TRAP transporter small permease [Falsigemmobacter faecalis]RRH69005.1 TRAP transporter small permease [Falsigemmobacter faecalis]
MDLPQSATDTGRAVFLPLRLLRGLVDVTAVLLFLYMTAAILVQIFGRYLFNYSIAGTDETATFAMIWLTLLGAGIAMRRNQHVGVDFLILACPRIVQLVVGTVTFLLACWFLFTVAKAGLQLVDIGLRVKSPAARLPMAVPYAALVVGFGYILFEYILHSLPRLIALTKPEAK